MVDISKYICEFLKSTMLSEEVSELVILDEGTIKENDYGEQLVILVEFKGTKYNFGLNQTNTILLRKQMGNGDTKYWVGKTFKLKKENIEIKGEKKEVMRVVDNGNSE